MDGADLRLRSPTNWCYCKRDNPGTESGIQLIPRNHGSCVLVPANCRKLDGVVAWLVNGVAAAFFLSLKRCSCVQVLTKDDDDDDDDDIDIELLGLDSPKE